MARKLFSKLFAVSGLVTGGLALLFTLVVLNTADTVGLTASVIWMALNFPAQVLSMAVHGDIHLTTGAGFYAGVFLEWFLIGYFVVRSVYNRRRGGRPATTAGPEGPAPPEAR